MAFYYLDIVNGNDLNSGTMFYGASLNPRNLAGCVLSNNNLTVTGNNGASYDGVHGSALIPTTGKIYWEVTVTAGPTVAANYGLGIASNGFGFGLAPGTAITNLIYYANGNVVFNSATTVISPYVNGNVISFVVDLANKLFWARVGSGNWNNNVSADPAAGTGGISFAAGGTVFFPAFFSRLNTVDAATFNFGGSAFAQTVPSGVASSSSSWYSALKTVTTGASFISSGDTVRLAKSPDPTNTGVNATWTKNNKVVTLASALTATVEVCDTAWTAANSAVTATDSTNCKQGTLSTKITLPVTIPISTKFAYKTLGSTIDGSGYKQVSFWMRTSLVTTATHYVLALCSDTTGDVIVHSVPLPAFLTSGWQPVTIDLGVALSTTINSVALYSGSSAPTASGVVNFDCIILCRDSSLPGSLTLQSQIGKNDGLWFCLGSIVGTTVTLDSTVNATPASVRPWYGVTETVPLYKRETTKIPQVASSHNQTISSSSFIFEGGWDILANVRNGTTVWDALNGAGNMFYFSNVTSGGTINYLDTCRADNCFYSNILRSNSTINVGSCCSHTSAVFVLSGLVNSMTFTATGMHYCGTDAIYGGAAGNIFNIPYSCSHGSITAVTTGSGINMGGSVNNVVNFGVLANSGYGIMNPGCNNKIIGTGASGGIITGNYAQVNMGSSWTLSGNLLANFTTSAGANGGGGDIIEPGLASGENTFYNVSYTTYSASSQDGAIRYIHNVGRVAGVHLIKADRVTGNTETTIVHTAGGKSWKMTSSRSTATVPLDIPLAKILVAANTQVTASVWVYRDTVNASAMLVLQGLQIAGVLNDVTAVAVGPINTWEQISLTFTPTEQNVVQLYMRPTSTTGGTVNVYYDDFSASQV